MFSLIEGDRSDLALLDLMKHILAPADAPGIFISGYGGDEFLASPALPRHSYPK